MGRSYFAHSGPLTRAFGFLAHEKRRTAVSETTSETVSGLVTIGGLPLLIAALPLPAGVGLVSKAG